MAENQQGGVLTQLAADVGYIRGTIDEMKKSMDGHGQVHVELNGRMNNHAARIRSLEDTRTQGRGMILLGRIISTAIGAIVGALVAAATIASVLRP
jgi:hypothetical protein